MAKSKKTAMTTTNDTTLAAAPQDALADILGDEDLDTDGFEELEQDDIKIAAKVFNMKGKDESGDPLLPNVFYDTVTEKTQRTVEGPLLTFVKSNAWTEYDEAEQRNKTICRSNDRETGLMLETGEERKCAGCPDAQWRNIDGKRTRNCGPVYTIIGIERLTQQPFMLRCKRTSLSPFQQYMNRYFINRRVVNGKRRNYPLFMHDTVVSLDMDDGGKYSIPKFTPGEQLGADELRNCAGQAKFSREVIMPVMSKMDQEEVRPGESEPTAGADDFIDDNAPPPAAAAGGAVSF